MALVNALNNPKISDTILFQLNTTDADGNLIDPYKVNRILIYYLQRDFVKGSSKVFEKQIDDLVFETTYFSEASVAEVFGNDEYPAWLSTDIDNAFIEKVDVGQFELEWNPKFTREGDYIICWTWTPLAAGDTISEYFSFEINGDTKQTTSIPTHFTVPGKYEALLERYLPSMFKTTLADEDVTPETLDNLNSSVAGGFTVLENLSNQLIDLLDANAVSDQFLPYLANMFNISLKSNDVTLWRRQIKQAVPLYKRKGTLSALREALDQSGINLVSFIRLYQIISPYTWQEAFVVEDEIDFTLEKLAIISPLDLDNFEVWLRKSDEDEFTQLTVDYVQFANFNGTTTMSWVGDQLSVGAIELESGDTLKVIYKIANVPDQSLEDYIRTLELADLRDDREVTVPKKNWNVRVIQEDDAMIDSICSKRNPLVDQLIFGYIRTEFPYSENVYNSEEYNGSIRPSKNPCDIDRDFQDPCTCCLGSKFIIDLEVEQLSDERIDEAKEIVKNFVPFHALVHKYNFTGSVNEFIIPPLEEIEKLVSINGSEFMTFGQNVFNRSRFQGDTTNKILRTALANSQTMVVSNGIGVNDEIVLYSPNHRFDLGILGVIENFNLLEILSGPNAGEYKVTNPNKLSIGIVQGSPDTINYPLDTASFPYRLSNRLFSGSASSIDQDDVFAFSDANNSFRLLDAQPGWKIEVTAPFSAIGTYDILETLPNDSLLLANWPLTSNLDNITYQLKTDMSVDVGDEQTTGSMQVSRRGKVNVGSDIKSRYVLREGDWALIGSTQYHILEFSGEDTFYIKDYTGGSVGVTSVKIFRRLIDNAVGYLQYKGMTLQTPVDHEIGLEISNGANNLGPLVEDNRFKENHLIYIEGNYYQMVQIDNDVITLSGPMLDWGLSGIPVQYTIIRYNKTSPIVVDGTEFQRIDRRNNEVITYNIETALPMAFTSSVLNDPDGIMDAQSVGESISMSIEWK